MNHDDQRFRNGFLVGLVAYLWWGMMPIYFRQIRDVEALEILAHRIVWCVVLLVIMTLVWGGWSDILRVLRSRKLVLTLALSAFLLSSNWLLYIYAAVNDRITEAGLGYYMLPLVNAFLATVFLGEKLRPAHYPALALVAVGVAVPMVMLGSGWLSLALPISFGFYGLVRKKVAVESYTGLFVESLLLLPFCLLFMAWQANHGTQSFGNELNISLLLTFGGVMTVVPLLAFGYSIRRLPLLTVTFIQFVSPSMQFLVALLWNGERPPWPMWTAIACVWVAVAIFMIDALWNLRNRRIAASIEKETALLAAALKAEQEIIPAQEDDSAAVVVVRSLATQEPAVSTELIEDRPA